jgi:transmembrane sensor
MAPQVAPVSDTELSDLTAWRIPRLELSGTPLADVLPLFNQYGGLRVGLADPALGRLQLSGILRADNTEALVRLLQSGFGLVAERRGDQVILSKPQAR